MKLAICVALSALAQQAYAQALGEYWQVPGTPLFSLQDADALIAANAPSTSAFINQIDFVDNYYEPPFIGGGRFPQGVLFPGITPVQGDPSGDFFAFRVTGYLEVPTSGIYTFGSFSDDGARLTIGGSVVLEHQGNPFEAYNSVQLSAGSHAFEVVYMASIFADQLELYSQAGTFSEYNTGFRVLGDYNNGGLRIVPSPSVAAALTMGFLFNARRRRTKPLCGL